MPGAGSSNRGSSWRARNAQPQGHEQQRGCCVIKQAVLTALWLFTVQRFVGIRVLRPLVPFDVQDNDWRTSVTTCSWRSMVSGARLSGLAGNPKACSSIVGVSALRSQTLPMKADLDHVYLRGLSGGPAAPLITALPPDGNRLVAARSPRAA